MAITVTQVGRRTVFGDRRVGFYDVVFSGTYPTGGEPLALNLLGMTDVDYITATAGVSTDRATSVVVSFDQTTNKLLNYESGAANAPLIEKNSAEAYITGQSCRIMAVGH